MIPFITTDWLHVSAIKSSVFDLYPHSQILPSSFSFPTSLIHTFGNFQSNFIDWPFFPHHTADMKFLATVNTFGLMFLALATEVLGSMCYSFPSDKVILTLVLKAASVIQRDQSIAAYRTDAILKVLETASELFAVQVVGALTSRGQLESLCQSFPSSSSRLQSQGYDTALIKKIFCAAAGGETIPSLNETKALTAEISTEIWIIQAIGAVQGKSGVKKLCDLINVSAASAIGLQGDLVKKDICAAATVADKVASSGQPAQVTLTAPLVNSIAPVSQVVLPFVPANAA